MLLSGLSHAATVITLGGQGKNYSFVTDAHTIHDSASGWNVKLKDGHSLTLTNTDPGGNSSKFWGTSADGSIDGTWTNTAAVTEVNANMGTSYSAVDFSEGSSMYYTAPGNQNGGTTLTLGFDFTKVSVGDSLTMYVTTVGHAGTVGGFSAEGLTNTQISYATNGGNGFSSSATFSEGAKNVTMIKITGKLTADDLVLTTTASNKSGFQTVAYNIASVPEPTTATLSLLTLAGLAARRRRR